jgi:hypothetical protein
MAGEQTNCNLELAIAIIAGITLIITLVIYRRWLLSFLPPKLEVIGDAFYRDELLGGPNIHWYVASIKLVIKSWSKDNIRDFHVQIRVDDSIQESALFMKSENEHSNQIDIKVGEGYTLGPETPIGPKEFTFKFMVRNGETIDPRGHIILKVGRWVKTKSFLLKLVTQ